MAVFKFGNVEKEFFTFDDIERSVGFKGNYVFYRAGFDCLDKKTGKIEDPTRIKVLIPSLERLVKSGAKVVIYSHNGRPDGEVVETLRMAPIREKLKEFGIKNKNIQLDYCVGAELKEEIMAMEDGEVILVENIRFSPLSVSENSKDIKKFAKELVFGGGLFKIYVNAAWPVSHRESADMTGVVKYIDYACADPQVIDEFTKVMNIIANPRRPYVAIIGGEKADKTDEVPEIIKSVDKLIAAGVFANSILYNKEIIPKPERDEKGKAIKGSMLDDSAKTQDMISMLRKNYEDKIVLPIDVIAADSIKNPTKHSAYYLENAPKEKIVPKDYAIVGIGPETIENYKKILREAGTVAWAGPFDVYENLEFRKGTEQLGYFLADGTNANVLICGGDTGDAAHKLGFAEKLEKIAKLLIRKIHISTGGGVNLPLLGRKSLPAIDALEKNYRKHQK